MDLQSIKEMVIDPESLWGGVMVVRSVPPKVDEVVIMIDRDKHTITPQVFYDLLRDDDFKSCIGDVVEDYEFSEDKQSVTINHSMYRRIGKCMN